MAEFFLEIVSDEIPTRALRRALRQIGKKLFEELVECGVGPREISTGSSTRRLVLCCRGLPEHEPDREERELGPSREDAYDDGEPTEALRGFAERIEAELEDIVDIKTEKGEYTAFVRQIAGRSLDEVLGELVPSIFAEVSWSVPKLRRGAPDDAWVRPLRRLVALLDGEILPLDFAGLASGATTLGPGSVSPEEIEVTGFDDYRDRLAERGVEISFEARRERLGELLAAAGAEAGGTPRLSDAFLDRLTLRCEVPGVVTGRFDPAFLDLPPEILATTLEHQQSAIALAAGTAELLPVFLAVMDRPDDPRGRIRTGHERAVAGHLADARFLTERDRRVPLAERARRLDQLTFEPGLGDIGAKSRRVAFLADLIARELDTASDLEAVDPKSVDPDALAEAASLAKADLTTRMGRHLPTLRGRLGGIYAREEGYIEPVWQAIYDQGLPSGLDDPLPRGRVGRILGVADRLDTLVGYFFVGQAPTGSRDPRGLRRLAQGLLRILIEGEMPLDLDLVAARAALLYSEDEHSPTADAEEVVQAVRSFLYQRLRQLFGRRGLAHDAIEAAMAVGVHPLPGLWARITALEAVREDDGFRSLVLVAKRIHNIAKSSPDVELKAELLDEGAEKDLYADYLRVRPEIKEAIRAGEYAKGLRGMAELVPALERFFAEVLVMAEDETRRDNRLALLQAIRRLIWRVARLKEMSVAERSETVPSAVVPETVVRENGDEETKA